MALTVKSKILMTVLSVVLMFTFFILIYFPSRQERVLLENYNEEIENFANSVALGVKIALTEQNFEGVETAIDFVRDDPRLQFVSLIQTESITNPDTGNEIIEKTVFRTFPEDAEVDVNAVSDNQYIYKTATFTTPVMSGEVMLSFSTRQIVESMKQIRLTSIIVSFIVFIIGLLIGYSLAKNISRPVLALRDAARKVGEGDLSQSVKSTSNDEIGELTFAFNKMVRDLNIEASVEKIRNRTIAMQSTDEWEEVLKVFLDQIAHLGLHAPYLRLSVTDYDSGNVHSWLLNTEIDEISVFEESLSDASNRLNHIINQNTRDSVFEIIEIDADPGNQYSEQLLSQIKSDHLILKPENLVISRAYSGSGTIEVIGTEAILKSERKLLQRLSTILDQSYTRYQDIYKSEIQSLEATKQASLDRIRGEISSMRSKDDLNRITPLVWRELTTLKVPFNRCGVFIIDQDNRSILCFLSTPDGKALGFFNMNIDDSAITKSVYQGWKSQTVYTNHWDAEDFQKWTNRLIELGHIKSQQNYQDSSAPPESLDLHFVPFKQGMLYVGNKEPLTSNQINLVKSLAEVFSIAFARYQDFTRLEKAKSEVENTLSELKSTQSQLVHAEKMASLGELTAGIAHEIQNPLNFVNNFSELSSELIEEVRELMDSGNHSDARFILNDLSQNLEKINHHGNRASSIVKGMLEHSRDGKSEKEFSDLNQIADEYLRLAYHGLRAKDKTFYAEFETIFDPNLPKVNVISQDISRVLLNLINNAFYAVSERADKNRNGYTPRVTVQTRTADQAVEIIVKDNGNGIPQNLVNKIFQPFFTTKPTGKGTGLGLSISYDIITKGHNGNLTIHTKTAENGESETGTEFIISLPVT
jgi:signal transduction histidine kinase/HAMP domain-containing protein